MMALLTGAVVAQPVLPEAADVYYALHEGTTLYTLPDSTRPYVQLGRREPVYVLAQEGHWRRVRTFDGAQGYVFAPALSNVWLYLSKHRQTLYLYRGGERIMKLPADLGANFFADKERRGGIGDPDQWRTPDGVFFIAAKNPRSRFYKALVLNYPNAEDAARGLRQGLISRVQHDAIIRAEQEFRMPPMNTALGGWIEIHGDGTGARSNWTQGCIALSNEHMDVLWRLVEVGTPVLIEP